MHFMSTLRHNPVHSMHPIQEDMLNLQQGHRCRKKGSHTLATQLQKEPARKADLGQAAGGCAACH